MYSFIGYIAFALLIACLLLIFYFITRKEKKEAQKWIENQKATHKAWEEDVFKRAKEQCFEDS